MFCNHGFIIRKHQEIFNNDPDIRKVLMQLINGYYCKNDPEMFRDLYNSLLNTQVSSRADTYLLTRSSERSSLN